MTKKELLEHPAFRNAPEDAEIMTQQDPVSRWDIFKVFYDEERRTIVIV